MRSILHRGFLALAAFSLLTAPPPRDAKADSCGSEPNDATEVAAARAAAEQCDCAGSRNHGQYVKCVAGVANDAVGHWQLRQACRAGVIRCAARSTCGRPDFFTCCRTTASGRTLCSTKRNTAACRAPRDGSACASTEASCCDACTQGACASVAPQNSPPPCSRPV